VARGLRGFGDLRVGMPVWRRLLRVAGQRHDQRERRRPPALRTCCGTVAATGDYSLTVQAPGGRSVTVAWNEATVCVIRGQGDGTDSSACSRIQVGDHIAAAGHFDGTTLNAHHIWAFVPGEELAQDK
jgi:hypothetical protein